VFELQAQEKGLGISLEYDHSIPKEVTLDIQRVKQILINLIGNALKFTFRGQISVTTSVTFSTFEGTPQLQIVVKDTGIGIRVEDREKIFQMLGKLEATASINTSGVGLGLSTCKKIAEALKGDIFLVDDEESEQQSLLPTKKERVSSHQTKK
jgi:signal transduction histidine kinase